MAELADELVGFIPASEASGPEPITNAESKRWQYRGGDWVVGVDADVPSAPLPQVALYRVTLDRRNAGSMEQVSTRIARMLSTVRFGPIGDEKKLAAAVQERMVFLSDTWP